MRNEFVYSCSIKICASRFNELFKSIFCLLLVVEVVSLQKAVEMLEAVVSWREVRWIWQMRQTLEPSLFNFGCVGCVICIWVLLRRTGPFLLTNGSCRHCGLRCVSLNCSVYFSDVTVSPGFRKLECIKPEADHPTVTMTFFWCKSGFGREVLWSFFSVQPLNWSSPALI